MSSRLSAPRQPADALFNNLAYDRASGKTPIYGRIRISDLSGHVKVDLRNKDVQQGIDGSLIEVERTPG